MSRDRRGQGRAHPEKKLGDGVPLERREEETPEIKLNLKRAL